MSAEQERLRTLNIAIGEAETDGFTGFFQELLAPQFAMRRANGAIVNRAEFIAAVSRSPDRTTEIGSITVFGVNRALVECIVGMEPEDERKDFHNVRLFIREFQSTPWMLLAWANEPAP